MSDADFRAAFHLLERTIALLESPPGAGTHPRAIQGLLLEFELLRARLGQPAAETQRN